MTKREKKMETYQDFCTAMAKQLFNIIDTRGSLLAWQKDWESTGCKQLPTGAGGIYHSTNLFILLTVQFETGFQSNQWLTLHAAFLEGCSSVMGSGYSTDNSPCHCFCD